MLNLILSLIIAGTIMIWNEDMGAALNSGDHFSIASLLMEGIEARGKLSTRCCADGLPQLHRPMADMMVRCWDRQLTPAWNKIRSMLVEEAAIAKLDSLTALRSRHMALNTGGSRTLTSEGSRTLNASRRRK